MAMVEALSELLHAPLLETNLNVELSFVARANACSCKTTSTQDVDRQLVSVKVLDKCMLEQPGALL